MALPPSLMTAVGDYASQADQADAQKLLLPALSSRVNFTRQPPDSSMRALNMILIADTGAQKVETLAAEFDREFKRTGAMRQREYDACPARTVETGTAAFM